MKQLRTVLTDNDPCYTDNHGISRNTLELEEYLRSLPVAQMVEFQHSAPYTQALNPVECAVRQLYHLMNFFLQKGHLSVMCWTDMARAAVYVMNRLPHPQSSDKARRSMSAYEIVEGRKPDLTDMIAGPGELVVADFPGAKANSGVNTGAFGYFVMPNEGGWLVRSFETSAIATTHSVRRLSAPPPTRKWMTSSRSVMPSKPVCSAMALVFRVRPPRPLLVAACRSSRTQVGTAIPTIRTTTWSSSTPFPDNPPASFAPSPKASSY